MTAYLYYGSIHCEHCAEAIKGHLVAEHPLSVPEDIEDLESYTQYDWPKEVPMVVGMICGVCAARVEDLEKG